MGGRSEAQSHTIKENVCGGSKFADGICEINVCDDRTIMHVPMAPVSIGYGYSFTKPAPASYVSYPHPHPYPHLGIDFVSYPHPPGY